MADDPQHPQQYLELLEGMKTMVDFADTLKRQFMEQGWTERNAEEIVIAIYRNMH